MISIPTCSKKKSPNLITIHNHHGVAAKFNKDDDDGIFFMEVHCKTELPLARKMSRGARVCMVTSNKYTGNIDYPKPLNCQAA